MRTRRRAVRIELLDRSATRIIPEFQQLAVGVIALWLAFSAGRPTRRTIAVGALSLVVSLASIGVYIEWRQAASGLSGLTTNSAWSLYARVAPWADCTKFTPPAETQKLCETTPPSRRGYLSSTDYIFNESPAARLFGPSFRVSRYPHAMTLLRRWSEAAILGQPLDYLHAVWLDTIRLVDPNHQSYGSSVAGRATRTVAVARLRSRILVLAFMALIP